MRWIGLLALLGVMMFVAQGAAAQVPDSTAVDLVSCWNLDEAAGTRFDFTETYDLTDNNTVGAAGGLVLATAAEFVRANSEYLSYVDDPGLTPAGDFTFSGWVYPDAGDVGSDRNIVSKYGSAGSREYRLIADTNDRLKFTVSGDGTALTSINESAGVGVEEDDWNWFLAEHDSGADMITLTVKLPADQWTGSTAHSTGVFDSATAFDIGAAVGGSTWGGRIGPVAYWSRLLTGDEKDWLYNSHAGRTCGQTGASVNNEFDSELVILPSGATGAIEKRMSFGEAAIGSGIAVLVALTLFTIARDTLMVWRARA